MENFSLKKIKSNKTGTSYILSNFELEKKTGPIIERFLDLKRTEFAYYDKESKPKFVFKLLNDEGTSYSFNAYGSSGEPFGKTMVVMDGSLFLGSFYPKIGFNGIVYRLREGENVRIQKYNKGLLVDECIDENIFIDFNVIYPLKFDCNYDVNTKTKLSDLLDNDRFTNKNKCYGTFVAGDANTHSSVLAASSYENNIFSLGQFKNHNFNGLTGLFSFSDDKDGRVSSFKLQTMINGRSSGDFMLSYVTLPSGSSVVPQLGRDNGKPVLKDVTEGIQITFKKDNEAGFYQITYYNKKITNKDEANTKGDLESDIKNGLVKRLDFSILDSNRKVIQKKTAKYFIDESSVKPKIKAVDPKQIQKKSLGSGIQQLNALIGLESVKTQIENIKNVIKKQQLNPLLKDKKIALNMVFYGNPGTGKTEVARLVGKILHEENILPSDKYIETDSSGLISDFVGQSKTKTHKLFQDALGGVLFIDEAYGLIDSHYGDSKSFGDEAIEALLKDMEDYRGQICVILAGYKKPMEAMLKSNPGWPRRINDSMKIDFPDYSIEELELIAKKILPPYYMSEDALEEMMKIVELKMDQPCFGNAGEVRNIIESIEAVQASRTMKDFENELGSEFDLNITLDDVKHYEHENGIFFSSKQPDIFGLDWIENESVIDFVSKLKDPDIKLTASGEYDAELLERYRLATVRIEKLTEDGKSTGTGFFISKEGLIATNFHVVDGAARLLVKCNIPTSTGDDWSSIEDAKVILADKEHDVAIIGLASRKKNCSYISLCSDGAPLPKVPSSVFMYGYPVGKQDIAFTAGQVSSINNETMHPLIEVDLSGKHGNSGSALIDVNTGKCIGIFSGASDNNPIDVIKYAWPIQHLWNLIK